MVTKLTQKTALALSSEREKFAFDHVVKGLAVRHRPGAPNVWFYRVRVGGKVRTYTLGLVSIMRLEDAREEAHRIKSLARQGIDFREQIKQRINAPTVADLSEETLKLDEERVRGKTLQGKKNHWNKYILPKLKDKKVSDIRKSEIEKMLVALWDKPSTYNGVLNTLSRALKDCEAFDPAWRSQRSNPCHGIKRPKYNKRNVILSKSDLRRLIDFINSERTNPTISESFHNLIYLLLTTGLRYNEWAIRKWADINFKDKTMYIERTKNGRSRTVFLSDDTISVLSRLQKRDDYIFGKPKNQYHVWKKYQKKLDLHHVHVHDLRHTVASLSLLNGMSIKEVSEMLGHTTTRTTEIYLNLHDEMKHDISNRAVSVISSYFSDTPSQEVSETRPCE